MLILLGCMGGGIGVERDEHDGSMAWEVSRGLLLAFMMHFSQIKLKTCHYMSSYRMPIRWPSSRTGSTVFLQEHAESIRSYFDRGMELREGEKRK